MIFSSLFFLFVFLPATLLLYFITPRKCKNFVILICSLIFYAWGEPIYIFLMVFSIVFNYVMGIDIDNNRDNPAVAKKNFIFAVVVNLTILGFFKYYGFFIENLNSILPFHIPYKELALPIGISFYTFQTLSYIIDVYRGEVAVQKNFISFGVYVSMFPQLIAGPIVKYSDVEKQLRIRKESLAKFGNGVTYFIRGLSKKVLLANNIGMVFDTINALPQGGMSTLAAWVGCIAYTFQIYFDFSGYSDMAIGLGKMFGFDFLKNFDYPYTSKSITEFWRRWHISLSSWFRDYVYIPLGGNRVGTLKAIRNIFVVWMLTGFWHGSAWNFVFWGIYYGVLLLLEKYVLKRLIARLPKWAGWLYTILLVMIGWVFFFSSSLSGAFRYIGVMFGYGASALADNVGIYYLTTNLVLFIIMAFCSTQKVYKTFMKYTIHGQKYRIWIAVAVYTVLFMICIAYLVNETYNPFLYFRF